MAVAGRLLNGLYAEPVYALEGMTLGESVWPGVKSIPQRIWAGQDVSGWLLPAAKILDAQASVPALGEALETTGWLRRGLAVLMTVSKSVFGLSGATFPVLASMIATAEVLKYKAGETILEASRPEAPSPCNGFHLLVAGGVSLAAPDGVRLTALPPGSSFGGTAQRGLPEEPSTVTAIIDSVVVRIPRTSMQAALMASPSLRNAVAGWPTMAPRLKEMVEVLLFVGDAGFPMRQLVDLLAQVAPEYIDRVAVVRLVPKDSPATPPAKGADDVWRGTLRLDPASPPKPTDLLAFKKLGNLEYIFLDASGVSAEALNIVRPWVTRVVICSSEPWKSPPFPLGPGRVNWCVQLTDSPVAGDPPYAPTTVRVKFDMAKIARASSLQALEARDQERFRRWFRSITDRRVGLALGGGGSWGWAHTTLIRAIRKAEIPIDMISGSSFGSMCGAFYCATHDTSFDALEKFAPKAQASTRYAFFSSVFMGRAVDRALREATGSNADLLLEHLEIPLFPVATNIGSSHQPEKSSATRLSPASERRAARSWPRPVSVPRRLTVSCPTNPTVRCSARSPTISASARRSSSRWWTMWGASGPRARRTAWTERSGPRASDRG